MTVTSTRCLRELSSIRLFLIMGFLWIGLGTFGLVFDPDKELIILSQFVTGIVCLVYFWIIKRIPVLELSDGVLVVRKRILDRKRIPVDLIEKIEENPKDIIFHIKDDRNVVIQRSIVQSQELEMFLNTLQHE